MKFCPLCHRRDFLKKAVAGSAAFFATRGVFAEALSLTPRQSEGPFFPDKLPLDTDNDLIIINDAITPAVGEITHLSGVVMDQNGQPMLNALVEIWETDHHGVYMHTGGGDRAQMDRNFQGYGRFSTDRLGRYYFRCLKPSPYPGRTPHIHVAVSHKNKRILTTQLYVDGLDSNARDGIYRSLDEAGKKLLTAPFQPMADSKTGELQAHFNIVIGRTPEDR